MRAAWPRLLALTAWLALVAVMVLGPAQPDPPWWVDVALGRWQGVEPWMVAHFMAMGVWPVLIGTQLRHELRARPLPAWPFALGSFALGAYALLPWFVLRSPRTTPRPWPQADGVRPWVGLGSALAVLGLFGWALRNGDPAAWWAALPQDGFLMAMSADFVVLWGLSVLLVRRDGGRWWWALLPLLGTALSLMARPRVIWGEEE